MVEVAMLAAATASGAISLASSLIRTKEVDEILFVKPALRPLEKIEDEINHNTDEKCPNCKSDFVKPYFQISMRRVQLAINLGSIVVGLLVQAILLFMLGNQTAGWSFIFWASLPGILVGRYVLELRDVFHYWNRPLFRNALSIGAISAGVITAENPYFLDFIGWISDPQTIPIGDLQIASTIVFATCCAIFIGFILLRFFLHFKIPSLRTRIVEHLSENSDGFTMNEWINQIDPKHLIWSQAEIDGSIRELVYQGFMTIQLDSRSSEPIYKAS